MSYASAARSRGRKFFWTCKCGAWSWTEPAGLCQCWRCQAPPTEQAAIQVADQQAQIAQKRARRKPTSVSLASAPDDAQNPAPYSWAQVPLTDEATGGDPAADQGVDPFPTWGLMPLILMP